MLAEIDVTRRRDEPEAKAIARRIATSPLVKTALFGHDANWGRVLMAAGSAPWNGGYATIDAERVTLATTARSCSTTARRPTSSPTSRGRLRRSSSISASATAARAT